MPVVEPVRHGTLNVGCDHFGIRQWSNIIVKRGVSPQASGSTPRLFQLHPTLDALPTFIYVKDRELRIVSVNQSYCNALGVAREDLVGRRTDEFLGEDGPFSARIDQEVIKSGEPRLGVIEKYTGTDGLRWVLTDKVPIKDADGTTIGLVGTSKDITERKEAEDAVQRSEARLRFLSEHMADILWTTDMEFRTTFVTTSIERMLGFTPEERRFQRLDEMATPESVSRIVAELQRQLQLESSGSTDPNRTLTIEVEYYHKNGSTVWTENVIRPIRDDEGNLIGMVGVSRDITARKLAAEALRESEEKHRALFEQSLVPISLISPEGRVLEANPAWLHMFGFERADLDSLDIGDCYVEPEGRARFLRDIAANGHVEDELQLRRKDGTVFDCRRSVTVLRAPDGSVAGFQNVFHDVTAQKKAERARTENAQKYRDLFEQSVDAVSLVSPGGKVLEANPAWFALFGYEVDDLAWFNVRDVYTEPEGRARFLQATARQDRVEDEMQFKRKDGTVFACHRVATTRRASDGSIIAVQSVCHDVTEAKRAEQALRDSEHKYRQLFDQSVAPISLLAPDGHMIEANDAWFQLFGYSRDDMVSFHAADLYPTRELRDESVRRLLSSGSLLDDEARVKTKDGTFIDVLRSMVVRHNPDGSVLGYQTVWRDITELNRTRDELLASREQLRGLALRIQEAREEERTTIARELHDHFGQELTALRLDLDSLTRSGSLDGETALARLRSALRLVDQMCEDVRDVISEVRPGMLDDLGLCAAIEWQAGQFSERTGITCSQVLTTDDATLPPAVSTALFRTFQELLGNVARHAGATCVDVSLVSKPDYIHLAVVDDGRGITAGELNNPASLGIFAIRERIRACNGTVTIVGKSGKGTTVTISVPIPPISGGQQARLELH